MAGAARPGQAWRGKAGKARLGVARPGTAWPGMAGVTMGVVVRSDDDFPVRYRSWAEWRAECMKPLPAVPYKPVMTNWCACCWGAGIVLSMVKRPNGQLIGYQRVMCEHCMGEGWA